MQDGRELDTLVHADASVTGRAHDAPGTTPTTTGADVTRSDSVHERPQLGGDAGAEESDAGGASAAGQTNDQSTEAATSQNNAQQEEESNIKATSITGGVAAEDKPAANVHEPSSDSRQANAADDAAAADTKAPEASTATDKDDDAAVTTKTTSAGQTLGLKETSSRTVSPAPPGPSISPAPTKKFQSSLAVNKKFLEKAADKSKPEVKAPTTARLATPPIATPVSTSHPRLLTGKISSTTPSASQAAQGQSAPAPTGWRAPVSDAGLPRPTPQRPGDSPGFSRDGFGSAQTGRGSGPVWGRKGDAGGRSAGGWSGGDFPTAAEAARAKDARARALAEQMEAKEKALQARAAANAHLLEQLDAFRGKHLDPNAAHWDEDDDDFLDDTIEFGDGTQYKVSEVEAAKLAAEAAAEPQQEDQTVEEPASDGTRAERFRDDYDRTWQRTAGGPAEARTLYNDRLGRLEPYAEKRDKGPQGPVRIVGSAGGQRPENDRTRRPSAGAPSKTEAKPPVVNPWNKNPPAPPQSNARRPSVDLGATAKRSSVDSAGRQLPPHMLTAAAVKSPPPRAATAILSPPRKEPAPLAPAPSVPTTAPDQPAEAPKEDIETVHAREMHAAAERAKKRREEEERQRLEQVERARKKAAELEEKQKKAEEEAAKEEGVQLGGKAADPTKAAAQPPADKAESWRRRPSVTSPPASGQVPAKSVEPMRILAREVSGEATKPSTNTSNARRPSDATSPPAQALSSGRPRIPSAGSKTADATTARPVSDETAVKGRRGRNSVSKADPTTAPARHTKTSQQQVTIDEQPQRRRQSDVPESTQPNAARTTRGGAATLQPATAAQTKQPALHAAPNGSPAIKLPAAAIDADDGTAHGDPPSVKLPKTRLPSTQADQQPEAPRGRQESRKSSRAQISPEQPRFELREPLAQFDRSRGSRSPSPPPAWRLYAVRLASVSRPRRPTPVGKAKAFADPSQPTPIRLMSYEPRLRFLGPNLSRDETLFSRPYIKGGKVRPTVRTPRRRIRRETEIQWTDVSMSTQDASTLIPRLDSVPEDSDGDFIEDGLDATTAPTAAALFDLSPERPSHATPLSKRRGVDDNASAIVKPRARLVTSELDGEIVRTGSKENLTAPGADPTYTSATPPPAERSQPQTAAMTPTSTVNWSSKAPMSLAVLDPIAMSVWSATPGESPARSRTVSHNANKPENSLHGLADDDYPAAVMPTSLAELKTEDEASSEERHGADATGPRKADEARLRAVAPSFASFNPLAGAFEHSSTSDPSSTYEYASSRQDSPVGVVYPSLTHSTGGQQHALYSQSTSPMMMHASAAAYGQPTSAFSYTTLTGSQGQTYSAAQQHSFYPNTAAAAAYQSPVMSAQQIAHPSAYASYGSGYGTSAYGAVGAVGQRVGATSYGRLAGTGGYRDVSAGPYGTQYHQQMGYRYAQPRAVPAASAYARPQPSTSSHQSQKPVDSNRYGSVSPVIMHQQLPPNLAATLSSTTASLSGGSSSSPSTPTSATAPLNGSGPALYGVQQAAYRRHQWQTQAAAVAQAQQAQQAAYLQQ
ncbi:hypothetical protein ACM66B_006124 [Microbotryomycetes sp. NB124-2]